MIWTIVGTVLVVLSVADHDFGRRGWRPFLVGAVGVALVLTGAITW